MEIKRNGSQPSARDRRTISLEQFVSIRCSAHPTPPAPVAAASLLSLARARHGRASRGNPAGRCGLDPAANEALARGRAHKGDDAHRDPGKARRQGCRLAGKGHGRAISQVISARTKGEGTMPHVIVKMHPGRSEQQKAELAEAIVKDVIAVAKVGEKQSQ